MPKNYVTYSFVFILIIFSGGCAPILVISDPELVVIENASAFNAGKVQVMANVACQKHGKRAIYRADYIRDGLATFECIK